MVAAIGATGIFVAAAAVGANQTRQSAVIPASPAVVATRTPQAVRRTPIPGTTPTPLVIPERSISGTVREVQPDLLIVQGPRGVEFRVTPAPGALIRLNGKAAKLDALLPNDQVVILGQAQPRSGFLAHAITAKRK
jgi:hypothetical protein